MASGYYGAEKQNRQAALKSKPHLISYKVQQVVIHRFAPLSRKRERELLNFAANQENAKRCYPNAKSTWNTSKQYAEMHIRPSTILVALFPVAIATKMRETCH